MLHDKSKIRAGLFDQIAGTLHAGFAADLAADLRGLIAAIPVVKNRADLCRQVCRRDLPKGHDAGDPEP